MKLLPIRLLESDSVLSINIYMHDGRILLPAHSKITEHHIRHLTAFGIYSVYIEDDFSKDIIYIPAISDATKSYALKSIQLAFENSNNNVYVNISDIEPTCKKIADEINAKKANPLNLYNFYVVDDPQILHALNVAIITAAIANALDFSPTLVKDYIAAAILHDIKLPSQNEKEDFEHVNEGYTFLKQCIGIKAESCISVRMHHEYFNGSGGPNKVAGEKINTGARIIAVADMYDRLVYGLGCKQTRMHIAAENINSLSGKFFDPQIVNIFNKIVSIYPLGSTVTLSNGYKAMIIKQNPNMPSRPIVRLMQPRQNDPQEINLLSKEDIFISEVEY